MGTKSSKLDFQEEEQVADNCSSTNTCQQDITDVANNFRTEASLSHEEGVDETCSTQRHLNDLIESERADFDFSYAEDSNDKVVVDRNECSETINPSHLKLVDPYFDDGNEEDIVFCSSTTCERTSSTKILSPFRSCNDLIARNRTYSNQTETEDQNKCHSEGDIVGKFNLKRRRKVTTKKEMLSKRLSSSSLLPIVFSTDPLYNENELLMEDGDFPTELSDLRPKVTIMDGTYVRCRSFHVITTAALPWMTGTAINPLLRAAYLNKMNRTAVEKAIGQTCTALVFEMMGRVTLVVPWLYDAKDQRILYGDVMFSNREEQELYIRDWLRTSANLPLEADLDSGGIHISFYDARYISELKSILPVGQICKHIDGNNADVCILDEPEHLNFLTMSDPEPFPYLFRHVVGIMHTNYVAYLKGHVVGIVVMPVASVMMSLTSRYHCHRIIKLSDTLQVYAKEKECVMNVHGIRQEFLDIGKRRNIITALCDRKIYYIGKMLWAKGLDTIIELENAFKSTTGDYFPIDIIGSGPEEEEIRRAFHGRKAMSAEENRSFSEFDEESAIKRSSSMKGKMDKFMNEIPKSRFEFRKDSIPSTFLGRMDHASLGGDEYKIFVNPSETEVLCTTTAEAIAMGKFVIIPKHPSNLFFEQFPNCLTYDTKTSFVSQLQYALENEPPILSDELLHVLTWEAATERLIEASIVTRREAKRRERVGQAEVDQKAADYVKSGIFETFRKHVLKMMRDVDDDGKLTEQIPTES